MLWSSGALGNPAENVFGRALLGWQTDVAQQRVSWMPELGRGSGVRTFTQEQEKAEGGGHLL